MLYKIAHTLSHNTMKINSYNVRNFPFLLFLCHDYSPFCIFIFSQFAVWNNFFHITFTFQLAFNKGNYDLAIAKKLFSFKQKKRRKTASFVIEYEMQTTMQIHMIRAQHLSIWVCNLLLLDDSIKKDVVRNKYQYAIKQLHVYREEKTLWI